MPNINGTSTGNDMQCINQNSDGSYEGRDCNGKGTNTAIFSVALQLTFALSESWENFEILTLPRFLKLHKSLMCLRTERYHIAESVTLLQLRVEVLGPIAWLLDWSHLMDITSHSGGAAAGSAHFLSAVTAVTVSHFHHPMETREKDVS